MMEDRERAAQEKLLRAAHDIIGGEIKDRLPEAHDDAQAELNEEKLIVAARNFVHKTSNRKCATGDKDFDDRIYMQVEAP